MLGNSVIDTSYDCNCYQVVGIHTFSDPKKAVSEAQAIFIGGGNTFRLLKKLYDNDLVKLIR